MKVKARDGKTYDVGAAPPTGTHEVRLGNVIVGSFVLEPEETVVTVKNGSLVNETLLLDIADGFVRQGGAPVGMA